MWLTAYASGRFLLPPDAAGFVAAAGVESSADPSSVLVQYGVLGLLVATLGPFAYRAYKWQVQRGDDLQQRLDRMTDLYMEKIIPAVQESTEAVRVSQTALRDFAPLVRELVDALARFEGPRTRRREP